MAYVPKFKYLSHLSPLTSEVVGAPQMTLQQYLSTLPLPSGNLQTPFPSIPWCYLLISSSVFLSSLLLSLSPAELSSPCPRILRCGHTIWVPFAIWDPTLKRMPIRLKWPRDVQPGGPRTIIPEWLASLHFCSWTGKHLKRDDQWPAFPITSSPLIGYPDIAIPWHFVRFTLARIPISIPSFL